MLTLTFRVRIRRIRDVKRKEVEAIDRRLIFHALNRYADNV